VFLVRPISIGGVSYYFDAGLDARIEKDAHGRRQRYGGDVARRLDIDRREVERSEFVALLRGEDPSTGTVLDAGHRRVRHAFFDVVFTAPKSVSLLFALSEPDLGAAVLGAHERARDATLAYLGREAAWVKQPTGERRSERAEGLCFVPFVHKTSRSRDPHLHSHVLVANLSSSAARGWSALDSGPIYAERAAAASLYDVALRYELRMAVGVELRERSAPGSDVVGFSDRVIDLFSSRSTAIRASLAGNDHRTARERRDSLRALRPPKSVEPPLAELVEAWRERAGRLGVVADRGPLRSSARAGAVTSGGFLPNDEIVQEVERSAERFTSAFTRRELIVASGRSLWQGAPISVFERRVDAVLDTCSRVAGEPGGAQPERSRRFDGRDDVRYRNRAVGAAVESEEGYRSRALALGDLAVPGRVAKLFRGGPVVVLAPGNGTPWRSAAELRILREQVDVLGAGERLFATSSRVRSTFEAATGPMRVNRALGHRGGAVPELTLVADAYRFGVVERERLVAESLAKGDLVVLCDLERPRNVGRTVELPPDGGPSGVGSIRWYQLDRRSIAFTDTLAKAVREVEAIRERFGPDVVVVAEDRLAGLMLGEVLSPSAAVVSSRSRPHLVVLGSAETVAPSSEWSRCTFVMPAPIGVTSADEKAMAFALMRPPSRLESASSLVPWPSVRLAWGWHLVVDEERRQERERDRSRGQELTPKWRAMSGRELEGRDRGAEEQNRASVSWPGDSAWRETTLST